MPRPSAPSPALFTRDCGSALSVMHAGSGDTNPCRMTRVTQSGGVMLWLRVWVSGPCRLA